MTRPKTAASAPLNEKPGPGRPPHERSEAIAKRIGMWVAVGVPVADVAALEGMSEPTLRKWYGYELQFGHVRANAAVAQALFRAAIGGDWRASAFWLRTRAGWIEAEHPPAPTQIGLKLLRQEQGLVAERNTDWESLLSPRPLQ